MTGGGVQDAREHAQNVTEDLGREGEGRFANRPYGGLEEEGEAGWAFVVIEGPRWYSAFLKWEEYVRLSYTHFPQRRGSISD